MTIFQLSAFEEANHEISSGQLTMMATRNLESSVLRSLLGESRVYLSAITAKSFAKLNDLRYFAF